MMGTHPAAPKMGANRTLSAQTPRYGEVAPPVLAIRYAVARVKIAYTPKDGKNELTFFVIIEKSAPGMNASPAAAATNSGTCNSLGMATAPLA